jgi:hypothetical protein
MESSNNSAPRRSEDIALDLLKFVATHANLGNKNPSSTGFGLPSAPRTEDQVTQIFDLYARCREAVESPLQGSSTQGTSAQGSAAKK